MKLGIIGDPVAHSISPAMHEAALRACGLAGSYERWHTPAAELGARIEALRSPGVRGANVTLPHKVAALELVDWISAEAASLGAINTIVHEDAGRLCGYNTDAPAVRDSLLALGWQGGAVVLLGAGGAARAALYALRALQAGPIAVINRSRERAAELTLPGEYVFTPKDTQAAAAIQAATLIINATALGWRDDDPPPLDTTLLHAGQIVYDMVYRQTPFLRAAETCGACAVDGLDMLVRQAGLAFELWTGHAAPLAVMRSAADGALSRR